IIMLAPVPAHADTAQAEALATLNTVSGDITLNRAYTALTAPDPDTTLAQNLLRLHALTFDAELVRATIEVLETKPALNNRFTQALQHALLWAEAERAKPDAQLHKTYQNIERINLPDTLVSEFKLAYENLLTDDNL